MIRLKGGRVIDPKNGRDAVGDVWIDGERIVDAAAKAAVPPRPTTWPARSSWPAASTSTPTSPAAT